MIHTLNPKPYCFLVQTHVTLHERSGCVAGAYLQYLVLGRELGLRV